MTTSGGQRWLSPGTRDRDGIGQVSVRVPKIRSRKGEAKSFQSLIVPPYIRRTATLDAAIPWLYFKGISSGQTQSALEAIVGPDAKGLSANVVSRAALEEVYPETSVQRCWMHKTGNILNYLPKSAQEKDKQELHDIWMVEDRAEAEKAFDNFEERFEAKYPKAAECLSKDRE